MAVGSADHVLRLLLALRRDGVLRVSPAAAELGVSPSTAHRLLVTMRGRGFVVQHSDRSYRPGPAFGGIAVEPGPAAELARSAHPAMCRLRDEVQETVSLMVLVGGDIHIIASVVSPLPLRVDQPTDGVEPAHRTAGGKVLLAELPRPALDRAVPDVADDPARMRRLVNELAETRRRGYGANLGESDPDIAALSVPVRPAGGRACAALSVVVPAERFTVIGVDRLRGELSRAGRAIGAAL